jgi:hypothetical protein
MRHPILLGAIAACIIGIAWTIQGLRVTQQREGFSPLVIVDEEQDRGSFHQQQAVRFTQTIRNISDQEVTIVDTEKSCGCLRCTVSTLTLPPKGEAVVTIELETGRQRHRVAQQVNVLYQLNGQPRQHGSPIYTFPIRISYYVVPDYDVAITHVPSDPAGSTSLIVDIAQCHFRGLEVYNVQSASPSLQFKTLTRIEAGRYRAIFDRRSGQGSSGERCDIVINSNSPNEPLHYHTYEMK